jgi:hypothetical protein
MADAPKSSFELAIERLRAADSSETKEKALSSAQKEKIAEARRVAAARLAECEILFKEAMGTDRGSVMTCGIIGLVGR